MKRILALLLVLCMMVGLLACGKPADNAEGTGDNKETTEGSKETTPIRDDISNIDEEDLAVKTEDENSNDAYITPEKFAGKTLQVAGLGGDGFNDLDNMGKGNYNWMMRAAIDEWATLNQVTIVYACGSESSTDIIAAINSGTKLDLQFGSKDTPGLANMGISMGFTQEQYDQLAKICGEGFVKALLYKGQSHGVMYPWTGNHTYQWNDTMFEQYGAKTPDQYLMEDNWNWTTMAKSWDDVTRDFNGNGKMDENDTYGMGGTSTHLTNYIKYQEDPQTGKLIGTIGGQYYKDFYDIRYKAMYQTLSHSLRGTNYCTTTSTPRAMAQIGGAEWYNFEHLYKTLENGDVIKSTVLPAYNDGVTVVNFTTRFMSMLSSCDEPEAAFSLLCYILKVGMKYISDYSVGLYKCEYEGIQGVTEWGKGWKQRFEEVCEDRRAAFAEIEDWDQEHYEKMIQKMFDEDTILMAVKKYTGEVSGTVSTANMPSASAIPLLVAEQDAWIAKYNELYAN